MRLFLLGIEEVDHASAKTEIVKLTPVAGVTGTSVLGVPLNDWVYIVTIVYVIVQCVYLVYRTFFKPRAGR